MLNNQLKDGYTKCYLVTFDNIFEHAKFKETKVNYFTEYYAVKIIQYNSKFCEIQTKSGYEFFIANLKKISQTPKFYLRNIIEVNQLMPIYRSINARLSN